MNKIIFLIFNLLIFSNIFATKELIVINDTNEKINCELNWCSIRVNDQDKMQIYKLYLAPGELKFINDNVISIDNMKVTSADSKAAAENKTKVWSQKLSFEPKERKVLKIYKTDNTFARRVYSK